MSEENQILQTGIDFLASLWAHQISCQQVEELHHSNAYSLKFLGSENALSKMNVFDDLSSYNLSHIRCFRNIPPVITK